MSRAPFIIAKCDDMASRGECAMVGPACDVLRWCWTGSSLFRGKYVLVK